MKPFEWSAEKNEWLRATRQITFEEILFHIQAGDILDVLERPASNKHPGQRVFVINVDRYAYLVPFVESDEEIFLKTIIPSRKMTRHYMGAPRHDAD